ncbi:hypothetical protein G6011_08075 [Alternaria panax]|uniref:Six-bladed beta-propeller, TolB-like protein n=1 Tax=Alternaria panax TaxID=48097 RepID=A0AAD4I8D9_9PLEO|nr:hypothetical protein G6011_08075 [Alternaria panax]
MHFIRSLLLLSSTAISLTTSLTVNIPKVIYNTTGSLENLAVRPNGNVLVTRFDVPQLWEINPSSGSAVLVHDFQSATVNNILGITEYEKDVYAVGVGILNQTSFLGKPGTWGVWKVDMRAKNSSAKVDLITIIPKATFLNGLAVLPPPAERKHGRYSKSKSLLVADSATGVIYKVLPARKSYEVFYSNPETMVPPPTAFSLIGLNGVKFYVDRNHTRYVYYSVTALSGFYRMRLDKNNVVQGKPELLLSPTYALDDFALAKDGTAYLTSNADDLFVKRERGGAVTVLGGDGTNGTIFAQATSVTLGRVRGKDTAYVSTFAGRLLAVTL